MTRLHHSFHQLVRGYRHSLQSDRRHLLEEFQFVQIARKVVGVGSVGTRAWILLMVGLGNRDPLFLQAKEAEASVLEEFVGKSGYANHGARVVAGQHLMQAASDIFLGHQSFEGPDGVTRDFYLRQLRDWKGSFEIEGSIPPGLAKYVRGLRPGAGPRSCPLGRPGRYRQLSRERTDLRPGSCGFRRVLCRSERARLRGSPAGCFHPPDHSGVG